LTYNGTLIVHSLADFQALVFYLLNIKFLRSVQTCRALKSITFDEWIKIASPECIGLEIFRPRIQVHLPKMGPFVVAAVQKHTTFNLAVGKQEV
jgi:hypothetical protein